MRLIPAFLLVVFAHGCSGPRPQLSAPAPAPCETGFVIAAPDMGFLGNERLRELHAEYAKTFPRSALAILTRNRASERLRAAIDEVRAGGASQVVVLPLLVSKAEEAHAWLTAALEGANGIRLAALPSADYLLAEVLRDQVEEAARGGPGDVLVVGYGAATPEDATRIEDDLAKIAAWNHCKWQSVFKRVRCVALLSGLRETARVENRKRVRAAVEELAPGRVLVAPLFLGLELDSMMSTRGWLTRSLEGLPVTVATPSLVSHPNVLRWLTRESLRHLPLRSEDVGVVMMPHGADEEWNEEVRETLRPIEREFKVEYAFSMADANLIQRAVDRLEARGCRHVIVLRVFSLESSFQPEVEYMVGRRLCHDPWPGHVSYRVRSSATLDTIGGTDDDPLYAVALLERARMLSKEPARETLFLVAHGSRREEDDGRWRRVLRSLGEQIQVFGGLRFRALEVGTWREDWPDLRRAAVDDLRSRIGAASRDGRAIVIEERTNGPGPGRELLRGLDFVLDDEGFAPHPNLAAWARRCIRQAIVAERRRRGVAAPDGGESTPYRWPSNFRGFAARLTWRTPESTGTADIEVDAQGRVTSAPALPAEVEAQMTSWIERLRDGRWSGEGVSVWEARDGLPSRYSVERPFGTEEIIDTYEPVGGLLVPQRRCGVKKSNSRSDAYCLEVDSVRLRR